MTTFVNNDVQSGDVILASDHNEQGSRIAAVLNGGIDSANLADASVSTAKIVDGAVTNAKLSTAAGEIGGTWNTWTPTFTGFSANPTGGIYRWTRVGKTVTLHIRHPNNGTSNATTLTMTAPVAAANIANDIWYGNGTGTNGAATVACSAALSANSDVISFFTTVDATGPWANTGNKRINTLTMTYEAA